MGSDTTYLGMGRGMESPDEGNRYLGGQSDDGSVTLRPIVPQWLVADYSPSPSSSNGQDCERRTTACLFRVSRHDSRLPNGETPFGGCNAVTFSQNASN